MPRIICSISINQDRLYAKEALSIHQHKTCDILFRPMKGITFCFLHIKTQPKQIVFSRILLEVLVACAFEIFKCFV